MTGAKAGLITINIHYLDLIKFFYFKMRPFIRIILFISFVFVSSTDIEARNYFTIADGNYDSNSIWSRNNHTGSNNQSAPCSCSPSCSIGGGNTIYIAHHVTIDCNVSFAGNATIRIVSGGTLTVTGNARVTGNGDLIIDNGAIMNVSGNFRITGSGSGTINGNLNISGSLRGGNNLCGTGYIRVGGTVIGTPCPSISLPIILTHFSAITKKEHVQLGWTTSSEINNDFFNIERSENGMTFIPICKIAGAGNSTTSLEYSFQDTEPVEGTSFYRLKQTDFDGKHSYSEILRTSFTKNRKASVVMYPNPITQGNSGQLALRNFPANASFKISIINAKGNRLYNTIPHTKKGNTTFNLTDTDAALASAGIYYIVIRGNKNGFRYSAPLIVY